MLQNKEWPVTLQMRWELGQFFWLCRHTALKYMCLFAIFACLGVRKRCHLKPSFQHQVQEPQSCPSLHQTYSPLCPLCTSLPNRWTCPQASRRRCPRVLRPHCPHCSLWRTNFLNDCLPPDQRWKLDFRDWKV